MFGKISFEPFRRRAMAPDERPARILNIPLVITAGALTLWFRARVKRLVLGWNGLRIELAGIELEESCNALPLFPLTRLADQVQCLVLWCPDPTVDGSPRGTSQSSGSPLEDGSPGSGTLVNYGETLGDFLRLLAVKLRHVSSAAPLSRTPTGPWSTCGIPSNRGYPPVSSPGRGATNIDVCSPSAVRPFLLFPARLGSDLFVLPIAFRGYLFVPPIAIAFRECFFNRGLNGFASFLRHFDEPDLYPLGSAPTRPAKLLESRFVDQNSRHLINQVTFRKRGRSLNDTRKPRTSRRNEPGMIGDGGADFFCTGTAAAAIAFSGSGRAGAGGESRSSA